jgi:hypothetical protein
VGAGLFDLVDDGLFEAKRHGSTRSRDDPADSLLRLQLISFNRMALATNWVRLTQSSFLIAFVI